MPKKMIHTLEELKDLQALPLDFKVAMTRDRIVEFYERMEGKVYVAFSGGKDSTVLLHIARSIYPNIKAVYANIGIDFPSVVKFVNSFDNVDYVQPKMRFATIIKKHGIVFPSKDASRVLKDARRGCRCISGNPMAACTEGALIIKPMRQHNRQLHRATILKGGIRKNNQAPKEVFGFRLMDTVRYNGQICFVKARRTSGYFSLADINGKLLTDSISYKKLTRINHNNYIIGGAIPLPH